MGDSLYYDMRGEPIGRLEWQRLFERWPERQVANVERDGVRVSTVWLGLNHQWNPELPPLIFESMVFGGDHDGVQAHYGTMDEALEGHQRLVRRVFGE